MDNEMAEALSAVTPATPAVEKIRPGAILVAIELDRDPVRSNKYTESIGGKTKDGKTVEWRTKGRIVAIKSGKVIAKNFLTGSWASELAHYKVKWCRAAFCSKCEEKRLPWEPKSSEFVPRALALQHIVWDAKDVERERLRGKEPFKGWGAWKIARTKGVCECGSRVYEDEELEAKRLNDLAQRALKDAESMEKEVPPFVPPVFFTLVDVGKGNLPPAWNWLQAGLRKSTDKDGRPTPCEAIPHVSGSRKAFMFNPGYWVGQVDSLDDPSLRNLFIDEGSGDTGDVQGEGL